MHSDSTRDGDWEIEAAALIRGITGQKTEHARGGFRELEPPARSSMNEARKLVAQCNVLGDEVCTILENSGNNSENQCQLERHLVDHSLRPNDRKTAAIPQSYPIMTRHNRAW